MTTITSFLNTRDSVTPTSPANCRFNITLDPVQYNKVGVVLESISFPAAIPPVNALNKTIEVDENNGAGTIVVALDEQSYTGTTLAAAVASKLTAASGAGITYTASYNTNTLKITVNADILNFRFGSNTTADEVLGLSSAQVDGAYSTSVTSGGVVRLDGYEYVNVVSSLRTRNTTSDGRSAGILARVHIDSAFGTLFTWHNPSDAYTVVFDREIDQVSLRLEDPRGRTIPLPEGCHVSYALRFLVQ